MDAATIEKFWVWSNLYSVSETNFATGEEEVVISNTSIVFNRFVVEAVLRDSFSLESVDM